MPGVQAVTTALRERAIAGISAMMNGPLPNIERRLLHEERRDLRERLALLPAPHHAALSGGKE
jgi:hypothetical protein